MIVIASVVILVALECLLVLDDLSLLICEVTHGNRYEVDQCPDTAASAGQELDYCSSHFADIESMDSESSEEEAKQ